MPSLNQSTHPETSKLSGSGPDTNDSAVTAAGSISQIRLVLAETNDASTVANHGLFSSCIDLERSEICRESDQSLSDASTDDNDGRVATEDEVRDLLHVVDHVPVRLWIACVAGILERFVWYGATSPLQNYLQNAPGGEVPGALGLGQATASNIVNALMIGSCITPVMAAVIADSWLGRYKTMLYAAIPSEQLYYLRLRYLSLLREGLP
ncbi:hypothetical protein F4805DRAFT_248745 [Annulohypoxylon moriforme]|nr:hypothetical protein F4805DRAFT_248745 [Annulohypoxylon moriforme]